MGEVTPFDRFHRNVEKALEKHLDDLERLDGAASHEPYCMCNECVCVRGVRNELASYAKRQAKKKPTQPRPACEMERMISWSGCNAEIACLHYRDDEDGMRPTALCKACSKASAKKRGKAK